MTLNIYVESAFLNQRAVQLNRIDPMIRQARRCCREDIVVFIEEINKWALLDNPPIVSIKKELDAVQDHLRELE